MYKNRKIVYHSSEETSVSSSFLSNQSEPRFEIKPIPGKGDGLIAVKNILYGELIFCEIPLLTIKKYENLSGVLQSKFSMLPIEKQNAILDLNDCTSKKKKTLEGIFKTNSISISESEGGLFLVLSKLNHSCVPNICLVFTEFHMRGFATKKINKGEELNFGYTDSIYISKKDRSQILQQKWGFNCKCELCTMPPLELEKVERARRQFKLIESQLQDTSYHNSETKSLMHSMLKSAIEGKILNPQLLYEYHHNMISVENQLNNYEEVSRHAHKALNEAIIVYGEDFWLVDIYRTLLLEN